MDKFELDHIDVIHQKKLDDVIIENLGRHTPMIYYSNSEEKENKQGVASAVFIEYQNKEYLITVGHTFCQFNINALFIAIVDIPISSLNGIIYKPARENDFSEMDYAIFWINEETSKKLKEVFKPFPVNMYYKKNRFFSPWNFVFGYPATKNEVRYFSDITIMSYCCMRIPLFDDEVINKTITTDLNIILMYDREKFVFTENLEHQIPTTIPKLNGISGCGIWSIPDYPFEYKGHTLQGIIIGKDNNQNILIGFTIQDIMEMIDITIKKLLKDNEKGIIISEIAAE